MQTIILRYKELQPHNVLLLTKYLVYNFKVLSKIYLKRCVNVANLFKLPNTENTIQKKKNKQIESEIVNLSKSTTRIQNIRQMFIVKVLKSFYATQFIIARGLCAYKICMRYLVSGTQQLYIYTDRNFF